MIKSTFKNKTTGVEYGLQVLQKPRKAEIQTIEEFEIIKKEKDVSDIFVTLFPNEVTRNARLALYKKIDTYACLKECAKEIRNLYSLIP